MRKTGFSSVKSVSRSDSRMSQPQPSLTGDVGVAAGCVTVEPYVHNSVMNLT